MNKYKKILGVITILISRILTIYAYCNAGNYSYSTDVHNQFSPAVVLIFFITFCILDIVLICVFYDWLKNQE